MAFWLPVLNGVNNSDMSLQIMVRLTGIKRHEIAQLNAGN